MKNLKGVLFGILCALTMLMHAQSDTKNNVPRAVLNYNADKTGTDKIDYNSSFLIFDHNLTDLNKKMVVQRIMSADASFKEIQLIDANGTKDMLVILHVEADNLESLTQKLRLLIERSGVYTIEYNNELMSLEKFRL